METRVREIDSARAVELLEFAGQNGVLAAYREFMQVRAKDCENDITDFSDGNSHDDYKTAFTELRMYVTKSEVPVSALAKRILRFTALLVKETGIKLKLEHLIK